MMFKRDEDWDWALDQFGKIFEKIPKQSKEPFVPAYGKQGELWNVFKTGYDQDNPNVAVFGGRDVPVQ